MTNTLHIIGPKNSGKTTLINFLIRRLTRQGLRIGAYKHSAHSHPLDKPGSDSDTFRQTGAAPVIFESADGLAVFLNPLDEDQKQDLLQFVCGNCHLVLVESFRSAQGAKIIIQSDNEEIMQTDGIVAVINKQGRHPDYPAFRPQSEQLVEFILNNFIEKV